MAFDASGCYAGKDMSPKQPIKPHLNTLQINGHRVLEIVRASSIVLVPWEDVRMILVEPKGRGMHYVFRTPCGDASWDSVADSEAEVQAERDEIYKEWLR